MAFMNIMVLRRAVMALKSLSEYLPLHSVSEKDARNIRL